MGKPLHVIAQSCTVISEHVQLSFYNYIEMVSRVWASALVKQTHVGKLTDDFTSVLIYGTPADTMASVLCMQCAVWTYVRKGLFCVDVMYVQKIIVYMYIVKMKLPTLMNIPKTFQKCNIKLQVFERVVTLFCNILYFLMSSIVVLYNERYMHLFILLVQ